MDLRSRPQPDRFFDGGTDDEPPQFAKRPRIVLERLDPDPADSGDFDRFRMRRRIGYRDEEYGALLVPDAFGHFPTDLTSVPTLLTWLVPKTGRHLPAALIHDGLISGNHMKEYISLDGHDVDRAAADRIFRNAMRDSGTGLIRRWLIWSAVTVATITAGVEGPRRALRYRAAAYGSLLVIAVLGVIATLDLVDVLDVLPWMGERPWGLEVVGGAAGAVVFPVLLGLTWGRFRIAGIVDCLAAAFLIHITVLLGVLTLLYQVAERIAERRPRLLAGLAAIAVAASAVLTVALTLVGG